MRLAYLVPTFPKLSETFVSREVLALRDVGFDVRVYAFARPSAEDLARMSPELQALADETIVLQASARSPAGSLGRLPKLLLENRRLTHAVTNRASAVMRLGRAVAVARQLQRDGIEHLHAHWPYATTVAHLAHLLAGIPYSVSIHAHEVAHENGHFPVVFEALSWAAFCNRAAMGYLLESLPPPAAAKAHLIYHGVDTRTFEPLPMPESTDPFRVVSAGRLTATKGFDRLIRACAAARERGVPVELSILGRGGEEERLHAEAAACGFTPHLDLPGWVPHQDVPGYLRRAHLFALPAATNFHDGLPNVVLEAMAAARPVVLSPLPAASEAVTHEQEGFLLDSADDVEGLTKVLVHAANHPEQLERLGRAARARVLAEHDASGQIRRMAALFQGQPPPETVLHNGSMVEAPLSSS